MNVSETAPGMYDAVRAKGVEILRQRHMSAVDAASSELSAAFRFFGIKPLELGPLSAPQGLPETLPFKKN